MQQDIHQDSTKLNQQQQDMLRLFKTPMPEQDYNEVRRFVVKTLAKNINSEMERLEKEKGWTQETYEQWGKEHIRSSSRKK